MNIDIRITDSTGDLQRDVQVRLNQAIDKRIAEILPTIDFNKLIVDRVNYQIDRSKYLSDSIIKNLVQQKIAREITDKILKTDI